MLISWGQDQSGSPKLSQILFQFLWFNKYIKIVGTAIHFPKFSNKDFNFISQLLENGRIISWVNFEDRYELTIDVFSRAQLDYTIPASRSSHRRCSIKKDVLKKFRKIHRIPPVPESLF